MGNKSEALRLKHYLERIGLLALLIFMGCDNLLKMPDGLYVNGTLVMSNATVSDYCNATGEHIKKIENNKEIFSIRKREKNLDN
jgi:hypothetical protein